MHRLSIIRSVCISALIMNWLSIIRSVYLSIIISVWISVRIMHLLSIIISVCSFVRFMHGLYVIDSELFYALYRRNPIFARMISIWIFARKISSLSYFYKDKDLMLLWKLNFHSWCTISFTLIELTINIVYPKFARKICLKDLY